MSHSFERRLGSFRSGVQLAGLGGLNGGYEPPTASPTPPPDPPPDTDPVASFLIAGEWTGSAGPVRFGTPGVTWDPIAMPAGFRGAMGDAPGTPAILISDGGRGLYIPAQFGSGPYSDRNAALSYDFGQTWAMLLGGGAYSRKPVIGGYFLGKYAAGYHNPAGDYWLEVWAENLFMEVYQPVNPAEIWAQGGICLHQGQVYLTLYENATDDVAVYRSAALAGDWMLAGRMVNAWDNALAEPYYAHIQSTGTRLVILTGTGRLSYSDDHGPTWSVTVQTPMTLVNRFVTGKVGGNDVYVALSGIDGTLWLAGPDLVFTAYTPAAGVPGFTTFRSVAFSAGQFAAVGDAGLVCTFTGPDDFALEDAGFPSTASIIGITSLT
jgi:hypothetical protein